jgi:MoaA/NifB/PqqE/SkfB family radical SAM enzyme
MAMRAFPLDGALLFFDRDTGQNILVDGEETRELVQLAPRSIQFGITNRCNLACAFCSRDLRAESRWNAEEAFVFLSELDRAGVLEVAFGGGEPFAFAGFTELVSRLHGETGLAIHATTNGLLLTPAKIAAVRGKLGELRLSVYDDNDWRRTVARLADEGIRFGVNLLVLPERVEGIEDLVLELAALGARDVLLLSYNGDDRARHLSAEQGVALCRSVGLLHRGLGRRVRIGLDICWGERMAPLPRFLDRADCGAGRDFLVVTSDKHVMPCSFHHASFAVCSASEVLELWQSERAALARPSTIPGCARRKDYGLGGAS